MSVQANGKPASPSTAKKAESVSTPKKRKHDAGDRESSKKKKQRTEAAHDPATVTEDAVEKKQKKKKRRDKDKDERLTHTSEEIKDSQDIELPDAVAEEALEENNLPHSSSVADDLQDELHDDQEETLRLLESEDPSSFYSTRLSLYLPIPAVSLEATASSILALHLAPLLLTYFPPAKGIILAFSDPVLSAKPDTGINLPLVVPQNGAPQSGTDILARTGDEFGACWTWLTVTFLVFRPTKGDELYGWTNVTSEGFVGLVSYNYFQAAIGKNRIPQDWVWNGPTRESASRTRKRGRKGKLRDEEDDPDQPQQEAESQVDNDTMVHTSLPQVPIGDDGGCFTDASGTKVDSTLKFRVVDTEVVPAHDRHKWTLQIDGTLLEREAEQAILDAERAKFERSQQRHMSQTSGDKDGRGNALMSGALRMSREGSVASRMSGQTPGRQRV